MHLPDIHHVLDVCHAIALPQFRSQDRCSRKYSRSACLPMPVFLCLLSFCLLSRFIRQGTYGGELLYFVTMDYEVN